MPRVRSMRTTYKLKDYSKWLKMKMVQHELKQADVAKILNISQQMFSYKLVNNKFTLEEFIILSNYFDAKDSLAELIIY